MGQLICQSLINGTGNCLVSLDGFLLVERLKGLLDLAFQNLVCSLCANFALYYCHSQLEGALSQWTSYQEDVGQFMQWMDRVEETLSCSDRQYSEMRDKTANLGKTKVSNATVDYPNSVFRLA